jgi:hypothetical protein
MFERELRFYREVAPELGLRTPALLGWSADEADGSITIELEDLGAWDEGGDPVRVATELRALHDRWRGVAEVRWPWLDRAGAAADEIGQAFDATWGRLRERADVTSVVRGVGDRLAGRIARLEREEPARPPRTLLHGDAAGRNVRTDPTTGEVAFLDWEDVRLGPGEVDLTWLLVSSVEPAAWDATLAAYGPDDQALRACLLANLGQALFGLADAPCGSAAAAGWVDRIETAAALLAT